MKGLDRARGEDSVGIAFATTDDKGNFEVALESVSKIDWVLRAGFTPSLAPDAKTLIPGNPLPNGTYTLRAVGEDTRAVATTTWVLELVAPPAPPPAAPPAAAPGAPPAAPPAAGKLSFEAAEYTNAELGFSVKYPKDWAKGELKYGPTVVYVAAAAAQVPVISVNIEEGAKFADAVALAVDRFGSKVKVSPEKETTLADGTKAYTAFVTYEPDIAPLEAKCFALGVQKGTKWVIVTVSTVDMLYTYNEAKFSEIVNTLQFKK
jgi:hypothetical protein